MWLGRQDVARMCLPSLLFLPTACVYSHCPSLLSLSTRFGSHDIAGLCLLPSLLSLSTRFGSQDIAGLCLPSLLSSYDYMCILCLCLSLSVLGQLKPTVATTWMICHFCQLSECLALASTINSWYVQCNQSTSSRMGIECAVECRMGAEHTRFLRYEPHIAQLVKQGG